MASAPPSSLDEARRSMRGHFDAPEATFLLRVVLAPREGVASRVCWGFPHVKPQSGRDGASGGKESGYEVLPLDADEEQFPETKAKATSDAQTLPEPSIDGGNGKRKENFSDALTVASHPAKPFAALFERKVEIGDAAASAASAAAADAAAATASASKGLVSITATHLYAWRVHADFLAAQSPYFRALVAGGYAEAARASADILVASESDGRLFRALVQAIYDGLPSLFEAHDVLPLLLEAERCGVACVELECRMHLERQLKDFMARARAGLKSWPAAELDVCAMILGGLHGHPSGSARALVTATKHTLLETIGADARLPGRFRSCFFGLPRSLANVVLSSMPSQWTYDVQWSFLMDRLLVYYCNKGVRSTAFASFSTASIRDLLAPARLACGYGAAARDLEVLLDYGQMSAHLLACVAHPFSARRCACGPVLKKLQIF